jgi:purine-nucleoside phosphorylase
VCDYDSDGTRDLLVGEGAFGHVYFYRNINNGAHPILDTGVRLMTGSNPLFGPNIDELGPRFPDMSQVYDRELMNRARQAASTEGVPLREGIYCALSGPSFEGPADLRFLRMAGADAVGMSTVPEAIVARHGGMRVLGLSGISNKANLDGSTITTHEEVIEAGRVITPKMEKIIRGVLRSL